VRPLRAVIFDLDALADIECAGHRLAFNAAFAALGLDIEWTVARYRQLQALRDERRRVAAELRKRGVSSECDVLAELLVDEICATKAMILDETILDADIVARTGLVELITEAFGAGIAIGVVSSGRHTWVALAELGASAQNSLAFAGSPTSQRKATAAGLPTVLIDGDDTFGAPLRVADCQRVHDAPRPSAA
jgi:beta-phosphoglucomutase-like phosphatase (HAD superfamily)